jgi:hypothetical protein
LTADLQDAAAADGLCSGAFTRWAVALAGRVAAVAGAPVTRSSPAPGTAPADGPPVDPIAGVALDWFPDWLEADLRARAGHLLEIVTRFEAVSEGAITPSALEARLTEHYLDWMRVEVESVAWPAESAAREARLCIREDGMSLSAVAIASRRPLERGSFLLEQIEEGRRALILSARPGEPLGPVANGDSWDLLRVVSKRAATLDDPDIRRRAEAAVVAALVAGAIRAVRWQVRL